MQRRSTGERLVDYFVAIPISGLALVSVVAFMGGWWWFFDLWSAFRVQYFAIALSTVLLAVLCRRRRWALSAVAIAALNGLCLLPFVCGGAAPASGDGHGLRVSFHNLNYANTEYDAVGKGLRVGDPDLIAVAELTEAGLRELRSSLKGYHPLVTETRMDAFGIGLFAKDPTLQAELKLLGDGSPAIEAQIEQGETHYELLVIHPIPPVSAVAARSRDETLAAAARWAQERKHAIVLGDFNATPWSSAFKQTMHTAKLENSQTGMGLQNSWPRQLWPLSIPIDHCLHSRDLRTVRREVGGFAGSDHRILRVELAPKL